VLVRLVDQLLGRERGLLARHERVVDPRLVVRRNLLLLLLSKKF